MIFGGWRRKKSDEENYVDFCNLCSFQPDPKPVTRRPMTPATTR